MMKGNVWNAILDTFCIKTTVSNYNKISVSNTINIIVSNVRKIKLFFKWAFKMTKNFVFISNKNNNPQDVKYILITRNVFNVLKIGCCEKKHISVKTILNILIVKK